MKNRDKETVQISTEELAAQERKRLKKSKRRNTNRALDRIIGFLLATLIMLGIAALGLEYVFLKGPSPALREYVSLTFLETRRFRWVPNIFLSQDEVQELQSMQRQKTDEIFDPSLITIKAKEAEIASKVSGKTAAEIVQMVLMKQFDVIVPESVKIVAQKDIKDCLSEFAISMEFAPPPSILDEGKEAAGKKKKGGR